MNSKTEPYAIIKKTTDSIEYFDADDVKWKRVLEGENLIFYKSISELCGGCNDVLIGSILAFVVPKDTSVKLTHVMFRNCMKSKEQTAINRAIFKKNGLPKKVIKKVEHYECDCGIDTYTGSGHVCWETGITH